MRLSVRVLGLELLSVEASTEDEQVDDDPGSITSYPVGFTASPGDQRWEQGAGGGEL